MLLEALLKQEEGQGQDNAIRNLSMAGGSYLGLVARIVQDEIITVVMPFVDANNTIADWHGCGAATSAFCSFFNRLHKHKFISSMLVRVVCQSNENQNSHGTTWTLVRTSLPIVTQTADCSDTNNSRLQASGFRLQLKAVFWDLYGRFTRAAVTIMGDLTYALGPTQK
ncbi:hypothetical protein J5N97_014862 [Dioscorea zingiberensis]|uniref:Uncharacterized protein n=1 Tax=Dioscorea zingiberensis TaxID=325984 RepID=A0A9D5CVZ0_9LILI|nr:hypothetical protein J5N97_014862 [Dioscorea zingiberensis]